MKITKAVTHQPMGTLAGIPVVVERPMEDSDYEVRPMTQIGSLFDQIQRPAPLTIRSAKEDLIAQIVAKSNTRTPKLLARRIAIHANRYKLTETDLHALLAKASDPAVKNFSALLEWIIKDRAK